MVGDTASWEKSGEWFSQKNGNEEVLVSPLMGLLTKQSIPMERRQKLLPLPRLFIPFMNEQSL